MTEYKLKYFDITGLGEVARYLFAYGNIKYEDIRISIDSFMNKDDYYKEIRKELPFGLLPTLEIDGKVITQSAAIARYLAIKVGLYGNDPMESLLIDEAYGNIDDLRKKFSETYWGDPAKKASSMTELLSNFMPYYLGRFDKMVGKMGGHFAIARWNLADFLFGSYLHYCNSVVGENIVKGYPNLEKLIADLEALPGLSDYIQSRPKMLM